jgi:NAD(P)-dependent dehydrogenase (short-subunit alcohol dehydrogenase family)
VKTGPVSMTGKTVLITGASGGIGKATALGLAAMGARVAIAGRDRERTASAADDIRAAGGEVEVFLADLSSQAQVRRLAEQAIARLPRIDVLINNVGGYWNTRQVTVDGLERTFALDHLAPFLLTNLLLERITASAPARVITVSSNAQAMGRIRLDDLQGASAYSGAEAYNQSKLANVLFTYELARRLAATPSDCSPRGCGKPAPTRRPDLGSPTALNQVGRHTPGEFRRAIQRSWVTGTALPRNATRTCTASTTNSRRSTRTRLRQSNSWPVWPVAGARWNWRSEPAGSPLRWPAKVSM